MNAEFLIGEEDDGELEHQYFIISDFLADLVLNGISIDIDQEHYVNPYENYSPNNNENIVFNVLFNHYELNPLCQFEYNVGDIYPSINYSTLPFYEDFSNGMPCDWENSHSQIAYGNTPISSGWTFGTADSLEGLIGTFLIMEVLQFLMMIYVIVICLKTD